MARLPPKERDERDSKILAEWKAGATQNALSKKYDVSPATVNKICKGVEQSNVDLVNTQISVLSELSNKSEYEVNAIHQAVDEKTKHLKLINDNATKLAGKLNTMADQIDTPKDLKDLVDANDKLAITLKVADRHAPKSDVNVQANQVQQILTQEEISKSIADGLPD